MNKIDGSSVHVTLIIRALLNRNGGAERIFCELANLLVNCGHRVTCLYFDPQPGEPFYPLDNRVERINLFGKRPQSAQIWKWLQHLPGPLGQRARWNSKNHFFTRQLHDYFRLVKPDLAISILPPANTPALMASIGTSVKVIACNHNVPEQDYNNALRWGGSTFERVLRLRALDHAAAIHVLSASFAEWFPPNLKERIVVIPNYVSPTLKWPEPRPQKEKVILAVGRLADVKNYGQLINSWAELASDFPDWRVRIFGTGPLMTDLTAAVRIHKLEKSVELRGSAADLSAEYAKASIFCHPAHFEGFGLSAAEALFMETPVVCYSDCDGLDEFVADGYNGLTAARKGDRDYLAHSLRRLMEDDNLRIKLGSNGPASVDEFTLDAYRSRWLHTIERIRK